jgi:hypothetical protein
MEANTIQELIRRTHIASCHVKLSSKLEYRGSIQIDKHTFYGLDSGLYVLTEK